MHYNHPMDPITALIAATGLLSGWVVNYLSEVLPASRRFQRPACEKCGHPKTWVDFSLAKNCEACGQPAHKVRYLLLLSGGAIAAAWLWLTPPERLGFAWSWVLVVYLCLVAVIDIEHRVILNEISIFGAVLGLVIGTQLHGIWLTLLGGAAGFAIMFGLYYLGEAFARWLARRRGEDIEEVALGFGDVNLSGVMGLVLGWPGVTMGIIAAVFLGGAYSLLVILVQLISRRYSPFTAIPYAPFIILGMLILLFR